jgi:hypothetical protein
MGVRHARQDHGGQALTPDDATHALLGGYGPPAPQLQLVGRLLFLGVLVLVGVVERLQFRLRFLEGRTWWASNGRDVLNGAAFAAMLGALGLVGFGGPLALLVAAGVLVPVNALQASLGTRPGGAWVSAAVALALGSPVVAAPDAVDRALRTALVWLFA